MDVILSVIVTEHCSRMPCLVDLPPAEESETSTLVFCPLLAVSKQRII